MTAEITAWGYFHGHFIVSYENDELWYYSDTGEPIRDEAEEELHRLCPRCNLMPIDGQDASISATEHSCPYRKTKSVTFHKLTTESGKKAQFSPNNEFNDSP